MAIIKIEKNFFGLSLFIKNIHVFFGSKQLSQLSDLKKQFSHYTLFEVTQVHKNTIVPASKEKILADGHYTSHLQHALCIKTADCMPILICPPQTQPIFALHAGWRGLAQNIISAAFSSFSINDRQNTYVFIGPHISSQNYEVDWETANQLFNSTPSCPAEKLHSLSLNNKPLIRLEAIATEQLLSEKIPLKNIVSYSVDTFSSKHHFSHRRTPQNPGRNWSFIAINQPINASFDFTTN